MNEIVQLEKDIKQEICKQENNEQFSSNQKSDQLEQELDQVSEQIQLNQLNDIEENDEIQFGSQQTNQVNLDIDDDEEEYKQLLKSMEELISSKQTSQVEQQSDNNFQQNNLQNENKQMQPQKTSNQNQNTSQNSAYNKQDINEIKNFLQDKVQQNYQDIYQNPQGPQMLEQFNQQLNFLDQEFSLSENQEINKNNQTVNSNDVLKQNQDNSLSFDKNISQLSKLQQELNQLSINDSAFDNSKSLSYESNQNSLWSQNKLQFNNTSLTAKSGQTGISIKPSKYIDEALKQKLDVLIMNFHKELKVLSHQKLVFFWVAMRINNYYKPFWQQLQESYGKYIKMQKFSRNRDFLKELETGKYDLNPIILMVSGFCGQSLIPKIYQKYRFKGIIVVTAQDSIKLNETWVKKYPRIVCFTSERMKAQDALHQLIHNTLFKGACKFKDLDHFLGKKIPVKDIFLDTYLQSQEHEKGSRNNITQNQINDDQKKQEDQENQDNQKKQEDQDNQMIQDNLENQQNQQVKIQGENSLEIIKSDHDQKDFWQQGENQDSQEQNFPKINIGKGKKSPYNDNKLQWNSDINLFNNNDLKQYKKKEAKKNYRQKNPELYKNKQNQKEQKKTQQQQQQKNESEQHLLFNNKVEPGPFILKNFQDIPVIKEFHYENLLECKEIISNKKVLIRTDMLQENVLRKMADLFEDCFPQYQRENQKKMYKLDIEPIQKKKQNQKNQKNKLQNDQKNNFSQQNNQYKTPNNINQNNDNNNNKQNNNEYLKLNQDLDQDQDQNQDQDLDLKTALSIEKDEEQYQTALKILTLYTQKDTDFYALINCSLNTMNEELIVQLQHMIKSIRLAFNLYDDTIDSIFEPNKEVILWRGCTFDREYFSNFFRKGEHIVFPAFSSTSSDLQEAKKFAILGGEKRIIFKIQILLDKNNFDKRPKNLKSISKYPEENEYLMNCFSLLYIQDIDYNFEGGYLMYSLKLLM